LAKLITQRLVVWWIDWLYVEQHIRFIENNHELPFTFLELAPKRENHNAHAASQHHEE
jgi:hypothetical protein